MQKICKYLSFGAVALLIVYMSVASVLEKFYGTDAVMKWGYHSPVFLALWAAAALSGAVYLYFRIIKGRSRKRIPFSVIGIHLAFILILAGALVSHVTGEQGILHLREGDGPVREYSLDDGTVSALPFSVELKDFRIEYYHGSGAPSDYVSTIGVVSQDGDLEAAVAMNRIFRYMGYRFYQASYDDDGMGSTLSVSHDPAGVAVTYAGYVLLLLCMAGFFFQRDSGFRTALRQLSGKAAILAAAFLLPAFSAGAAASDGSAGAVSGKELPKHLPEETAREYGRMYVYYNDRICPMQTLARDFTMKLYGRSSYRGLSAEQVLTGWIFFHNSWQDTAVQDTGGSEKARMKARDREEAIMLVCSARLLKIFPYEDRDDKVTWYSSVDNLPYEMDEDQWIFVRKVMSLAGESIMKKDFSADAEIFGKIREYQRKTADGVLPDDARIAAERIYNALERPKAASMLCLVAGLFLFVIACFRRQDCRLSQVRKKGEDAVNAIAFILSVVLSVYLTAVFILRWYISGHIPMSNGFETMVLLAWNTMMLTVFMGKRFPLVRPFGFLLAGFALLVASFGESDPQITHMMPVLSSPLLSVHVMCMMISYTLLGLVMLNSLLALVRHYSSGETSLSGCALSRVVLYPAVFFLAAGTFLGAVWANVSWGRYWAWDPKEVWALITLLVYAFALHGGSLKAFRSPVFFHWFCLFAFLCVVITYFGVNFFLGGLHSYA